MITHRKEPMANLIREHRMLSAHMADVASGRVAPQDDDDEAPKQERHTYSLVWHEMPWCDGWNVRCDQTEAMMREEPFRTERLAQEFLEALEDGVEL